VATPALLPRTDEGRRQRRRPLNRGRRAFLGGAVAAAGGWFIASSPLGMWPDVGSLRADFRTATGERRDLRIADVDVAMGARTRLSRVRGNALELEEGEAQFTLPAQTTAPFALQVQGAHVLPASGARVDIRCVGQDVRVSCLQGAVDIRLGQRHVHLQPGWQARLQGTRIAAVAPVPRERVDAWRQGWLVFDDQPLTQVVEEINRYRPGRVMIAGRELAQRRVQARIPLDRIDSIIQLVRDAYGARVLRMPGGVVVLG
ncbi:TPA: FecR domain-containing protein, partial [Stenotrophomonas maltophilia]|nr:FecR domain-containing protein [Stenotrophomonas maltophilia]